MALVATTGTSKRYADGSGRVVTPVTVTNDANGNVVGQEDIAYTPGATVQESATILAALVRSMIDRVKAQTAGKVAPLIPANTTLDLSVAVVDPPTGPTAAELARREWARLDGVWQTLKNFQARGYPITQQSIDDAASAALTAFRPEYVDL